MRRLMRRIAVLAGAVTVVLSSGMGIAAAAPQSPAGFHPPAHPAPRLFGQARTLSLTKIAEPATFTGPGERITYHYTVTNNSRRVVVLPVVVDSQFGVVRCRTNLLLPGRQTICGPRTITTTPADVTARKITNTAVARGLGGARSAPVTVTVRLAQAPGHLVFTPSEFNFGDVGVDHGASQLFELTNTGSSPAGPLTFAVSGEFTVDADPGNVMEGCDGRQLEPHQSCMVNVDFNPTALGTVTGTLTALNAAHAVVATAALTGTGAEPAPPVCSGAPATPVNGAGSAHLYWSNYLGDTISRAALDGTAQTTLVTGAEHPKGMAVAGSHIYWAAVDAAAICEANLDGTGVKALVPASSPDGVAVAGGHIYWVNSPGACPPITPLCVPGGSVMQANLDGTGVKTLAAHQQEPTGLAVNGSHIYWADSNQGTITEASLNDPAGTARVLISGQDDPQGMALDSSHIYWADEGAGTIREANLDGSRIRTLVRDQRLPIGVAVDTSHIYWTDAAQPGEFDVVPNSGTILDANLDNPEATVRELVTGQDFPWGVAVGPQHH